MQCALLGGIILFGEQRKVLVSVSSLNLTRLGTVGTLLAGVAWTAQCVGEPHSSNVARDEFSDHRRSRRRGVLDLFHQPSASLKLRVAASNAGAARDAIVGRQLGVVLFQKV